jgi:hypothetical protein
MFDTITSLTSDMTSYAFVLAALYGADAMRRQQFVGLDTSSALPFFEGIQAVENIRSFAELQDNWADEGSLAPSQDVLRHAEQIAKQMAMSIGFAEISAMPNGTIAFDWDTERGSANLEIGKTRFSFYIKTEDGFYPLSGPCSAFPSAIDEVIATHLFQGQDVLTMPVTAVANEGWGELAYA